MKFLANMKYPHHRVDSLLDNAFNTTVVRNRPKLASIVPSIIFVVPTMLRLKAKIPSPVI